MKKLNQKKKKLRRINLLIKVPPESIERASGLLFFDRVSRKQLQKINGKKA